VIARAAGQTLPAVVLGAGPGGLAAAAELRRHGVDAVVVDGADAVGASWRGHYDRLHLHTVRWLSGLPGLPMPRRYGPWVARDDVVAYLEDYVRHHGLEVRLGTTASGLAPHPDGGFTLRQDEDGGDTSEVRTPVVVVATGYNHTPRLPDWPGRETFRGELLHASCYRSAAAYAGRDVLVVGAGNTGAEIAVDLVEHGAARVRLAVRTPPHVVRRQVGGVPAQLLSVLLRHVPPPLVDPGVSVLQRLTVGDLTAYGLPKPTTGMYRRIRDADAIPILDVGLVDALKAGTVDVVAALERFDHSDVCLADGSSLQPDVVVVAVGYDHGLEPLVGHLGVLRPDGRPTVHGAQSPPGLPGLYFTGYTNPVSGMFRELALDARRIARAASRLPTSSRSLT